MWSSPIRIAKGLTVTLKIHSRAALRTIVHTPLFDSGLLYPFSITITSFLPTLSGFCFILHLHPSAFILSYWPPRSR
jgi:hypothetical protein